MLKLPDVNRLKAFYCIFVCQSVAGAAKQLNITQSAVSQQLKKLEDEIQTRLFTRLHKRLVPTADGQQLFRIIEPFFSQLAAGLTAIQQAKKTPAGELRVGAPEDFGKTYLPEIFASFRRNYPKVRFSLLLGDPKHLLQWMDQGEVDFALVDEYLIQQVSQSTLKDYAFEQIIDEEIVLAASQPYYETHLRDDLSLANLCRQEFISSAHDALALQNWFSYHFDTAVTKLNVVLKTDSLRAVINGIQHGMGLGIVASHMIYDEIEQGGMIPIPTPKPAIVNRMSLAQLQEKTPSLTEKVFLSHFRQQIHQADVLKNFSQITGVSGG